MNKTKRFDFDELDQTAPFEGFARVVIDHEGTAVSHKRAHEMGIEATVGFRRNDGWTLGAPEELEDVAFRLWADSWTHIIRAPSPYWTKIH